MTEAMKARKEQMLEMRMQGMTYEEKAAEFGLTRQRVYQLIGKNYHLHRTIKEDECVYEGLRNWMNEHGVNKASLCRMMFDGCLGSYDTSRVASLMRGANVTKNTLDRAMRATGLTYEQAFGGAAND